MNLVQFNQKEMKKAKVYMYEKMAGTLTEDENGFRFQYDQSYLKSKEAEPVSLTLPLTNIGFESKTMFYFNSFPKCFSYPLRHFSIYLNCL